MTLHISFHLMYKKCLEPNLRRTVQWRTSRGIGTLLLAQLLLELGKLMHRNDLLLIHNLFNTLDLLDLEFKVSDKSKQGKERSGHT
jgi:hypothetical protein